jgi:hypothetical protein
MLFTEQETGKKVDIHEFDVDWGWFDVWRLRIYLGSLGRRGVKLVSNITGKEGFPLEDNIRLWLSILLAENLIAERHGYYHLRE